MTGASRCSTVADLEGAAPAGPGASRSRAHGWWERFALLRRRHSSGVCAPMKGPRASRLRGRRRERE